jgi:hypothetical protein
MLFKHMIRKHQIVFCITSWSFRPLKIHEYGNAKNHPQQEGYEENGYADFFIHPQRRGQASIYYLAQKMRLIAAMSLNSK